ncbi:hypothetical protein UlMin_012157 [Ulmus minor]
MASLPFPITTNIFSSRKLPHSPSFKSQRIMINSINPSTSKNNIYYCGSQFSCHPLASTQLSFSSRPNAEASQEGEEDPRALEAVLRLYAAIKNKNIRDLSDLLADECQCFCNFFSSFQPFQGKNEVLYFFSYLIKSLGNGIEFIVSPTLNDGVSVGIQWKLECKKTHMPLGTGFSFYICHTYKGKVLIRNVEMFLVPLLHFEPLRLKLLGCATTIMDKISRKSIFRDKTKRIALSLLMISFLAALIYLFKYFFRPAI